MIMGKNPECHPERQNTPCGCFGVELSKICNELLIFESQNAAERFEDLPAAEQCSVHPLRARMRSEQHQLVLPAAKAAGVGVAKVLLCRLGDGDDEPCAIA